MAEQSLKTKNYIYQIGDGTGDYFILPRTALVSNVTKPIKQQYTDVNTADGAIRTNLMDRNFLGAIELKTSFIVQQDDYFDLGYVKKVFNKPPQKAFFYTVTMDGDVQMFFNPFMDTVATVQPKDEDQSEYGQLTEKVDVTLKSGNPFVYECKPNIAYFDYDAFSITRIVYEIGGIQYAPVGLTYGTAIGAATIALSSLTLQEKKEFFLNCNTTKALVYSDKFFDKSSFDITAGQEVIDATLTSNSIVDTTTTTIYKNTTADNRIYLIEITGVMNQGEWVEIQNTSNNSSFRLIWEAVAPSPSVMYYNSQWEKVYQSSGAEINPLNYSTSQTLDNFLYFSPLSTQNKTLLNNFENMRLQKNSTNNLTIKIENLNTYQL